MKPNEHNAQFSVLIILFFLNKFPYISLKKKEEERNQCCIAWMFSHFYMYIVSKKNKYLIWIHRVLSQSIFTHVYTLINFWQDSCVLYRFELSPNFLNTIYIKNKFKECEKKKLRNEKKSSSFKGKTWTYKKNTLNGLRTQRKSLAKVK